MTNAELCAFFMYIIFYICKLLNCSVTMDARGFWTKEKSDENQYLERTMARLLHQFNCQSAEQIQMMLFGSGANKM